MKQKRTICWDFILFVSSKCKVVFFSTPKMKSISRMFHVSLLRSAPQPFTEFLVNQILDEISEKNIHRVENSLHSVIVLSYTNLPIVKFTRKSDKFLSNLCTRIEAEQSTEVRAKLLYSLLITVQHRLKCKPVDDLNINKIIVLAAKFVNSSDYLCSLRILYNLAENNAFECLNSDKNKMSLIDNLSSPFHKVIQFCSNDVDPILIHEYFPGSLVFVARTFQNEYKSDF